MNRGVLAVVALFVMVLHVEARVVPRFRSQRSPTSTGTIFQRQFGHPGAANCTYNWFTQYIDHYAWTTAATYQQLYLTYDAHYKPGGPIFFYAGNEGPIEAFADIAGLMWENAKQFNAALVFAEHRFFGSSMPCNGTCMEYLSTQQAMADYAVLLSHLQRTHYNASKGVICFGGSYGGMLSAWMRIKYPNIITGSVASSAPIVMVSESYNRSSYWSVISRDATPFGGSTKHCSWNVHRAIMTAFEFLNTDSGLTFLNSVFKPCTPFTSAAVQENFGYFIQGAFDLLGMGDYPFPIDFIFGTPEFPAPAWPMRVACEFFHHADYASNETLLQALMNAISVVYNVTQNVQCYDVDVNPTTDGTWDYMVCSEGIINELPYFNALGWPNDMFYPQPVWTKERTNQHCMKTFNLTTRFGYLNDTLGAGNVGQSTNILFANGLLDPWHSGGILEDLSETVRSVIVPHGAHHLDLFFSTPHDPPGTAEARYAEVRQIRKWLRQL